MTKKENERFGCFARFFCCRSLGRQTSRRLDGCRTPGHPADRAGERASEQKNWICILSDPSFSIEYASPWLFVAWLFLFLSLRRSLCCLSPSFAACRILLCQKKTKTRARSAPPAQHPEQDGKVRQEHYEAGERSRQDQAGGRVPRLQVAHRLLHRRRRRLVSRRNSELVHQIQGPRRCRRRAGGAVEKAIYM